MAHDFQIPAEIRDITTQSGLKSSSLEEENVLAYDDRVMRLFLLPFQTHLIMSLIGSLQKYFRDQHDTQLQVTKIYTFIDNPHLS